MNRQFEYTFTNGLSVQHQNSFFDRMAAQGQDPVLNSIAMEGHDPCLGYMVTMGENPVLNDVNAQNKGQDLGQNPFRNDLYTLDQDPLFASMTVQGQQGVSPQGQAINGNALASQGNQNMMVSTGQNMTVPMGQNMGFNPVAQQAQGIMYPSQQMGNQVMPQGMMYAGQNMGNQVMNPAQNMGNNMMHQNPCMGGSMMGQVQNNMGYAMMGQSQNNMGNAMMGQVQNNTGTLMGQAQNNMGTPVMAQAQSNMASPMVTQPQNNMNRFGAQLTTNVRAPLGEIRDGANRRAVPSGPTNAQRAKEPVNNNNRGVKRQAETQVQGAAPKRRDMGGSSKSTPSNSNGVSSNGPAVIVSGSTSQGSTSQDTITNAPGANAPVSGLDLNTNSVEDNSAALERDLESAMDANFLGIDNPAPGLDVNTNPLEDNSAALERDLESAMDADFLGIDNPVSGLDLNTNPLEINTSAPGLDFQSPLESNSLGTNKTVSGQGLITNPLETAPWFPGPDFQNVLDPNPLDINTVVPVQNIQSAAAVNPPAAVSANGQVTSQPGPSFTVPAPPITPPHDGHSALEKEERKKQIFRIWERFKSENDIAQLCSEMPVLAERAKYQGYLKRYLETEKASVRAAFRQYLAVGLPALVRNQPVIEPLGFSGNVNAAVEAAKAIRQADGALPQAVPQASDEMITAKIDEQMAKLETMLPAGLTYGPVEYAKTRPLKLTLPALADPNMPGGTTGPRIKTCQIVRGEGHRVYGGHRGGDFIFRYRGRREYAVDSLERFEYVSQVARTSAELEHRRDAIAQHVWDVMRAILGFDPYTNTELAPQHRPGVVGVRAVFEEGPGSVRQQWNARFGVGGTAPDEFRKALYDIILTIDVMREFGWLGWTLREERGKADPPYYKLLIDMIDMITRTRDNNLRMSYDQSQEKTAKGLAFYLGEFGDRVVVCLESAQEVSFPSSIFRC